MSGEFEAAGAMATAGLVAGAIEGREAHEGGEGACLNCGAALAGNYCSNCGQAAHPHRTMTHVFEEFLHGVLHFDTKAWRTLPMVIGRPGTLTRNYVYGQRARYISPLALFLFTIFLMFFAFAFIPPPAIPVGGPEDVRANAVEELNSARADLAEAQRELAAAQAEQEGRQAEVRGAQRAVARAQAEVDERQTTLATIDDALAAAREESGLAAATEDAPAATPDAANEGGVQVRAREGGVQVNVEGVRPGYTWQDELRHAAESDDFVVIDGLPWLNERIRHKFENPDLALYKIQQAAYKFSFLLVPISLPFVALLFLWKRKITLYDHVVYTLYSLSFASLVFVAIVFSSMSPATEWLGEWLIAFAIPIHTFFHLKGAYALGWWSALWRTFFMLIFATVALTLFLIVIIVLGLAG